MPQLGLPIPSPVNEFLLQEITVLLASYEHWFGEPLLGGEQSAQNAALGLWEAPMAVVSHLDMADPIFWYGNKTALCLFEMSWNEFVTLPSRLSAEPGLQQDRQRLLAEVRAKGFSKDYRGVRVSKTGRRFQIENAVVWNLVGADGRYHGQTAMFDRWTFLQDRVA